MDEHLEHWMKRIVDRLDCLIEIGRWLEGEIRLPSELESKTVREAIEPAEPAWEPKVGDWVRVNKPESQERGDDPEWLTSMDQYDGQLLQVKEVVRLYQSPSVMCHGNNYAFRINWLSHAEPPEPEYREPVLPGDLGKWAEFSNDGINWMRYKLCGCYKEADNYQISWTARNIGFRYCRIRKDS